MERQVVPVLILASNGILPTRGSLMLDVVFVAMFLILAAMFYSVFLVRTQQQFKSHRTIQISLAVLLAIAIVAFEIDMRFFTDWRELAKPSPFYEDGTVNRSLWIHLVFAIPTPFVWAFIIWRALHGFRTVQPGNHSDQHRIWGRIGVGMMTMTAITGWVFYWLAFVA